MISRIPIILGPFRSGTSLVAAVVHRLGFQVSEQIMAPAPPAWRSDWEDPVLTGRLMQRWVPSVDNLERYIERRREQSAAMGFDGYIAIKCAYLAPHWQTLVAATRERPFVIRTYRQESGRVRSISAHPALSVKDDAMLERAIHQIPVDVIVGCEWAQENPLLFVQTLAKHLGVADDAAVAAAAALIGPPTRY